MHSQEEPGNKRRSNDTVRLARPRPGLPRRSDESSPTARPTRVIELRLRSSRRVEPRAIERRAPPQEVQRDRVHFHGATLAEQRERTTPKQKREWPQRKDHKPPQPPVLLRLTNAQKDRIQNMSCAA